MDFNNLPEPAFTVLSVFAALGVILGGYELIRLAIWLFNHVRFV